MLPGSVDARANMKMTLGHDELLPDSSSFRELDWRASREMSSASGAGIAIGEAKAIAVIRERMVKDFMVKVSERTRRLGSEFFIRSEDVDVDHLFLEQRLSIYASTDFGMGLRHRVIWSILTLLSRSTIPFHTITRSESFSMRLLLRCHLRLFLLLISQRGVENITSTTEGSC